MSDAAFKTGAYPGYTTAQLRAALDRKEDEASGMCNTIPFTDRKNAEEVAKKMRAEITRREAVAAGDVSVMTPGERLRFYQANPDAAH